MLEAACAAIVHRGPDDGGIMADGSFGFGMRRLSIVDIPGGCQPMHSPDRRWSIVFNGEVYNCPALRRALEHDGRSFATASDTEVILAGFERWGDAVWARLDGMFAVAIWDHAQRRLTLARDPTGIKPLYVTDQPAGFAFASELKALIQLPGLAFDTDPRGVLDLFRFGHVRTPRSIYRQVATLPPGHVMVVDGAGPPRMHAYWQPRYRPAEPLPPAAWVERFRAQWLASVRGQMVADVEVGAFLSGGVDSSAVVAAMTEVGERPVRTFTIGFPDPRYDESHHAAAVAHHLGSRHTCRMLDLADVQDVLPAVAGCYDEPFADPSAVPTWYLARLAAQEVKVALSGDGGDELFFGYKRHLTERRVGAMHPATRGLASWLAAAPATPWRGLNGMLGRWQKTGQSATLPDGASRFFAKTQITSAAMRRTIFAPDFLAEHDRGIAGLVAEYAADPRAISPDGLEQFALMDLQLNLPGAMLTKVDRASMAHSLEVRVPMLSQSLVDLALAMPADVKLRDGTGKWVVRQAVAPWLPAGILDRRKQGFQMPLSAWFAGDFGRFAEQLWRDSGVRNQDIWQPRAVDRAFAEHRSGRRDHSRFLYTLAIYCLWWLRRAS